MEDLIQQLVQWLHTMGIHPSHETAAAVGDAVGQAGAAVGGAVAPVVAKMDMPALMALAAALGWASGFRLYAVVFLTGAMGYAGWIPLPEGLKLLMHPAVMTASGFMLLVEFFADKIPWIDSLWDTVHSVIRIPAGALLAAGVFGADSATMGLVAGILGGSLAATAFATKATTRAAINTSPEPVSNWLASQQAHRYDFITPWDALIPLVPEFIWVYFSFFIFIMLPIWLVVLYIGFTVRKRVQAKAATA